MKTGRDGPENCHAVSYQEMDIFWKRHPKTLWVPAAEITLMVK